MLQEFPSQDHRGIDERDTEPVIGEMSDGRLIGRLILHQDQAAFEALVRRHGPRVRAVCQRLLRDGDAAEDAYQETFLVLLRKAHLISKPELLAGWLYGVASRIARHLKSRTARRWIQEKRATSDKVADPFDEVARRELCAVLSAAVKSLPERYRDVLILYYWEGKTSKEVARQLGCPIGSLSWRLGRGRELLRRRLSGLVNETAQ